MSEAQKQTDPTSRIMDKYDRGANMTVKIPKWQSLERHRILERLMSAQGIDEFIKETRGDYTGEAPG